MANTNVESHLRILSIAVKGLKNVGYGKVSFPLAKLYFSRSQKEVNERDLIGIYGPNGSGKSTIIEALSFLQLITIPSIKKTDSDSPHFEELPSKWYSESSIEIDFLRSSPDKKDQILFYRVRFKLDKEKGSLVILGESLSTAEAIPHKPVHSAKEVLSIDCTNNEYGSMLSQLSELNLENLISQKDAFLNRVVELATIRNRKSADAKSFLLSEELIAFLNESPSELGHSIAGSIENILFHIRHNYFVYHGQQNAFSDLGHLSLTGIAKDSNGMEIGYGKLPMEALGQMTIEVAALPHYQSFLNQVNDLVGSFVPGFTSIIQEISRSLRSSPDGKETIPVVTLEVVRVINGHSIPLSEESNGIKKLVNLSSCLINVFSNKDIFLAIDEFDSGVYEYLLGEILQVFSDSIKGQLLFTAHNLKSLEVLDKSCLYFTTKNENNRYVKLVDVKANNNLRDFYIRAIQVGGQKEEIIDPVYASRIRRALVRAYRSINKYDDKKDTTIPS